VADIKKHGIRNAAQTTVAPTGTIATVAGCEGYGCEPVFALAYVRHVNDNGQDLQLTYTSPRFERALLEAGLDEGQVFITRITVDQGPSLKRGRPASKWVRWHRILKRMCHITVELGVREG